MIDGLKPYPAVKDSGVPWLGKLPEHWQLQRTKILLRERIEKGHPDEPLLAATQSKGVVRKDQYENRTVLALKDLHLLKLVRVGDFVISLRSFQGGIEYAREQGIISPAYTILFSRSVEMHGYLARLFKSAPYIENLSLYVTGIRQGQNIDYEKLGRAELPLPPLPEQSAVVRFLDHADRRIQRYIRAKQKLIKLLEEQKQAIIHRAVTRGLDANVRLKPSGVEWLGDVPEHWEVVPLKRVGSVRIGLTYSPGDVCDKSGTLVLRASNIQSGQLVHADDVHVSRKVPSGLRVRENDILVCVRSGSRDLVGKCALITKEFEGVSYGAFMSLLRTIDNGFYYRVLNSNLLPTVMAQFETSTINQLTQNDLRSLAVPVPPSAERAAIAKFVDARTSNVDAAVTATAAEIQLLREYRTRLIADVVTGKLDVREAAARLPDESEESEPLDEIEAESDAEEIGFDDAGEAPEAVDA